MTSTPAPPVVTPAPLVVATVTGKDLLDQLGALHESVVVLTTTVADIPGRVRALEAWRWKAVGVSSALSAILSSGVVAAIFEAKR